MAIILIIPLWKSASPSPPFRKGGRGDFKNKCFLDKQLKALSQHLRKNMTDEENP